MSYQSGSQSARYAAPPSAAPPSAAPLSRELEEARAAVADQREKLSRAVKKGKGIAKELEETAKELEGTKQALEEARQAAESAEAATPPPPDTSAAEAEPSAERKARAEGSLPAPRRRLPAQVQATGHEWAKVKFGSFTKEGYDEWKANGAKNTAKKGINKARGRRGSFPDARRGGAEDSVPSDMFAQADFVSLSKNQKATGLGNVQEKKKLFGLF